MTIAQDEIETDAETAAPRRQIGATWFRAGLKDVADLILPPLCLGCGARVEAHHTICAPCWRQVTFIRAPVCDRLGIPLPYDAGGPTVSAAALANPPDFDRARAATGFSGLARDLIHQFKYQDRHEGRRLMARWLVGAGHDLLADADLLVPVPLYRRRLLWRRYNQAAMLALDIASATGVVCAVSGLERRRATRAQVGLSEAERRRNVQGAFRVPTKAREKINGRKIVLIDDVITTGATVNACARALKRAGAARVDVLAVSMVTAQSTLDA